MNKLPIDNIHSSVSGEANKKTCAFAEKSLVVRALTSTTARLLLTSETRLLRFWFALASIGFAIRILLDHHTSITNAVQLASPLILVLLFTVHGTANLYGVFTSKYSHFLLFLEGVLGVFLWVGLGVTQAIERGIPEPILFIGGGVSLYLFIRYPTHYGREKK